MSEAWADEMEREQMKMTGVPLIPKGIRFESRRPNVYGGRQVVVNFDDGRGVVIAECYVDPKESPVLVREYKLVKVKPSQMAVLTYGANVEMGASDTSF